MTTTLQLAQAVRTLALEMVHRARASHIGSALSIADIVAVLYGEVMNIDPADPGMLDRDRFLLSKGHACVAVYAVLAAKGFFPKEQLMDYGKDFSDLMNHISHKVPGVEFSTGSLGHALPFGVGKALAAKRSDQSWRTFVLLGDGECDEGSVWEAAMFASHHRLDNLIAIVDYNGLQSLTTVERTLALEPLAAKFESFGWSTRELDGHSHGDLAQALSATPWTEGKPSVVIARTVKGKGVSFMEGSVKWHYSNPNDAELEAALTELRGPRFSV